MPPALIGGAISAGTSILGGILGSDAANKAAQQQAAAGKAAASQQTAAGQQAQTIQQGQISAENANAQPYTQLGSQASGQLSNFLQGPLASETQFTAPTAAQAAATPGYQFQLSQGINALQNSAAARGGLLSTGTAKNLNNYAQGVASTNYQNTYNNALQAYNTNLSAQNQTFNQLYSTTGLGANATANLNNVTAGSTNALTGGILGNASQIGSDLMGVGNAQAAGTVGSANALTGGLSAAGNAIGQGITLQGILGAQNSYSPFTNSSQVFAAGLGPAPGSMQPSSYGYGNALQAPSGNDMQQLVNPTWSTGE
jgi:hypothetical protein